MSASIPDRGGCPLVMLRTVLIAAWQSDNRRIVSSCLRFCKESRIACRSASATVAIVPRYLWLGGGGVVRREKSLHTK